MGEWVMGLRAFVRGICIIIIVILTVSAAICEQSTWDCPECGRKGNTGLFCGNCAQPSPEPKPTPKPEIKAGDIVSFGRYEQDNNSANGREKIEWIVLEVDKKNKTALLISRYGLRGRQYNSKLSNITWEQCSLRSWLNEKFLQAVFSEKEQAAILTTAVDNSSSQGYSEWKTDGGKNTKDKLFLLSYAEAKHYFGIKTNNLKSRVAPTAYAIAQGAWINENVQTEDGKPAGWWWLRSPGSYQNFAAAVLDDGSLHDSRVHYDTGVVRPALWIDLGSGLF